jgi:molybdate transport system ATP-binding protein
MGLRVDINKRVNGFSLDVSWEIGNELAVLFGYSGAGKTLTLKLIAGLMKPDSGLIRSKGVVCFDSNNNIDLPPQDRFLGYVFQDLSLFPHMTVRENILYGAKGISKSERNDRLVELAYKFHIQDIQDKMPAEISGGQKQRTAFARALFRRPSALLLDEPFSALDRPLRMEMQAFLKEVRRDFAVPVILVTHDPDEARALADRMIVYSGGKVMQTGKPSDIFNSPETEEVRRLVGIGSN